MSDLWSSLFYLKCFDRAFSVLFNYLGSDSCTEQMKHPFMDVPYGQSYLNYIILRLIMCFVVYFQEQRSCFRFIFFLLSQQVSISSNNNNNSNNINYTNTNEVQPNVDVSQRPTTALQAASAVPPMIVMRPSHAPTNAH